MLAIAQNRNEAPAASRILVPSFSFVRILLAAYAKENAMKMDGYTKALTQFLGVQGVKLQYLSTKC